MKPSKEQQPEIHKLVLTNPTLYEELKARELEYINLIKQLHEQNSQLRSIIKKETPVQYVVNASMIAENIPSQKSIDDQSAQIPNQSRLSQLNRTPEFIVQNSTGTTNTDRIVQQKKQILRISDEQKQWEQKEQLLLQMLSDPIFSIHLGHLLQKFKEIKNGESKQKQNISRGSTVRFHEQYPFVMNYFGHERLWKMGTHKTIRDDTSSYDRSRHAFDYVDGASEQSFICETPKNSQGKIKYLIHRNSMNNKKSNQKPLKTETIIKPLPKLQPIQNDFDLVKNKSQQQLTRTLRKKTANNRPQINNKIYL